MGISRCAGLPDGERKKPVSGGALRGCRIDREKRLFLGELPLRGAARWREGEACFWGSSRCTGLQD